MFCLTTISMIQRLYSTDWTNLFHHNTLRANVSKYRAKCCLCCRSWKIVFFKFGEYATDVKLSSTERKRSRLLCELWSPPFQTLFGLRSREEYRVANFRPHFRPFCFTERQNRISYFSCNKRVSDWNKLRQLSFLSNGGAKN